MPDPITTLALATGGAFLGKFVGPAAEALGKLALERAQQAGARATAMLSAVGREPQPVEPKLLLPVAQGAGLESDPALAELWAALLANAADPAQQVTVQPGFAEVLRQLTPTDARVLQHIYRKTRPVPDAGERQQFGAGDDMGTRTDEAQLALEMKPLILQASVDNLLRLRLCKIPDGTLGGGVLMNDVFLPTARVVPTVFGYLFLQAVTPPTP